MIINTTLRGGYTPPDSHDFVFLLGNKDISFVALDGIASSLEFGSATASNSTRYLSAEGIVSTDSLKDSHQSVRLAYVKLYPSAIRPGAYKSPAAKNGNQTTLFTPTLKTRAHGSVVSLGATPSPQVKKDSGFEIEPIGFRRNRAGVPSIKLNLSVLTPSGIAPKLTLGNAQINNKTPSVFIKGIAAPEFTTQMVSHRNREVRTKPLDSYLSGYPTVTKPPELAPRGIRSSNFSEPNISNKNRYVHLDGLAHSKYGAVIARLRNAYVATRSHDSLYVARPWVSDAIRYVFPAGSFAEIFGGSWASRGVRFLLPTSVNPPPYAVQKISRKIIITPIGYEATLWGSRITPLSTTLYPLGAIGAHGNPVVQLGTNYIKPKGFISVGQQPGDRWGWHIAYNSTQYINHYFVPDDGLVPPKWSEWQSVENRNKTIGVIGFSYSKHGYTYIQNNARLLQPRGDVLLQYGSLMAAYRIRHINPESIVYPGMSSWGIVRNSARILSPAGIAHTVFGGCEIVNTRRYYNRIGNFESLEFGLGMVAERVRAISIEARYSIAPAIIRLPVVDNLTKYIDLSGYEDSAYGQPALSIHFNIIAPKWVHREKPGSPALKNLTPELLTRGHDSSEFGITAIRTQWRELVASGDRQTLIGLHHMSDTKQFIAVRGWVATTAPQGHKLTRLSTNPYVTQYVWLNNESGNDVEHGIKPPVNQLPRPGLNQNVLYMNAINSQSFGALSIRINHIIIDSGIAIHNISNDTLVYNKRTYISKAGAINSGTALGKPRLSPHTIWAVMEAPPQAIDNHKSGTSRHYVGNADGKGVGARLGKPVVESSIRHIRPTDSTYQPSSRIGRPLLVLRKRIIKTDSFRVSRFGVPSIPFTPQSIGLLSGIHNNVFGTAVFNRPPYLGPLYISPKGLLANSFGRHDASNLTRYLSTMGSNSLQMGLSKPRDTPFMWQGLRVGEHVPLVIGGYESLVFGTTTAWHKIREMQPIGFNAFSSGYELSNFRGRMTVSNATLPEDMIFEITVPGREGSVIGQHGVKLGQHFIRPDGNSEQFRKGAW